MNTLAIYSKFEQWMNRVLGSTTKGILAEFQHFSLFTVGVARLEYDFGTEGV
jgi:hypothetical protein